MSNFVNYQVELIPANAPLIDKMNSLLLGDETTAEPPKEKPKAKETKTAKVVKEQIEAIESGTTLAEFKKAAKAAKTAHGEDFVNSAVEQEGAELQSTLGRTISKVDPAHYDSIIANWVVGPAAESDDLDDGLDDDDFGDEPAEKVDPEAVATALKAYAKSPDGGRDKAKQLMTKHGAKKLSDVASLTADKLAALFKELV